MSSTRWPPIVICSLFVRRFTLVSDGRGQDLKRLELLSSSGYVATTVEQTMAMWALYPKVGSDFESASGKNFSAEPMTGDLNFSVSVSAMISTSLRRQPSYQSHFKHGQYRTESQPNKWKRVRKVHPNSHYSHANGTLSPMTPAVATSVRRCA